MAKIQNKGSIFTSVEKKRQKRSTFNLSHDVKLSLDMAHLVPCYVQECVPGDKINISSSSMLRLAPLISPVMHKINVYMEYFFVPNRILWDNWETFITGSRNGKQLSQNEMPAFPTVNPYAFGQNDGQATNMVNGTSSLVDYLGLPTREQFPVEEIEPGMWSSHLNSQTKVSALPFAAYQRIFDEYYRDENLMQSIYDIDSTEGLWENYNKLTDGTQPIEIQNALANLNVRAWEHDYFTSALPWAQKGEEVKIPIDLQVGVEESTGKYYGTAVYRSDGSPTGSATPDSIDFKLNPNNTGGFKQNITYDDQAPNALVFDSLSDSVNHTTINDLRAAIKLQEWLETNARGGSRYFESIYAHFGVQSPDSRLQRPEFIGSHRSNMIISEVLQTSSPQTENDTPQGNMSGHGQNVSSSRNMSYYCQEHGYIIGIISVLPKTAYDQGIPKHFLKTNDRLDFYFPEFAHLGEQEILNREIYAGTDDYDYDPDGTFGYTPRYSEYKFINSRVAGDFRDTLNFWHLGRKFENGPNLNDIFIGANPSKRIFAVQDIPQDGSGDNAAIRDYDSIYAHVFHDVKASRLMPKYGTPTL